jgi:nitrite reductase (NO-forming)
MHRQRHLIAIVVIGLVVVACSPPGSASTATPMLAPTAAPTTAVVPANEGGAARGTLEIEAFDLGFRPATLDVAEPGRYTVRLTNTGAIPHDVTFPGGEQAAAGGGETATVEVDVPEGGLSFICSIPGHEAAGMSGSVGVGGTAAGGDDDHGGPSGEVGVAPDPAAPPPLVRDAAAPPRLEGDVHDIDLVMTEEPMTVAEGYVQAVWTFNGTVPGPVIRVKVGDTVRVHLRNAPENALSHSIDFHASQVAWNDEMRSIAPGEELLYEWIAEYAGVWMYHCGTSPTLHHIANGMYGMVIVEPRDGLPPADTEFALVQSEWYLGPQGEPTDLAKAMAAAPAPDFVVFNGVANQYVDDPLRVDVGTRVRAFVLNAGPSVDSSFHVVGTIFDTVTKEGVELRPGNAGSWGAQAVDLAPAQGAIIEFTTAEEGLYPVVTHAFNLVGRGALGFVQAGDGDPTN